MKQRLLLIIKPKELLVIISCMHLQGRTVLFITHRLSSITAADLIVCMGDGSVLEIGTHEQLMEKRGAYYVVPSTRAIL